jgi:hypothetical protein
MASIQDRMRAFDDACAIRAGYRQDVRKALETTLGEKVSPKVVRDLYAMGTLPNCFPVPAIRLATLIAHDRVLIAEYDQEWDEFFEVYEYPN